MSQIVMIAAPQNGALRPLKIDLNMQLITIDQQQLNWKKVFYILRCHLTVIYDGHFLCGETKMSVFFLIKLTVGNQNTCFMACLCTCMCLFVLICKCFPLKQTLLLSIWAICDKRKGNPTASAIDPDWKPPPGHTHTHITAELDQCALPSEGQSHANTHTHTPPRRTLLREIKGCSASGRRIKGRGSDTYQLT